VEIGAKTNGVKDTNGFGQRLRMLREDRNLCLALDSEYCVVCTVLVLYCCNSLFLGII